MGEEFRAIARRAKPVAVMHHPHTTVKVGTWKHAWNRLSSELPSVNHYLGTGAYSHRDHGWGKQDGLESVLDATQRGDVFNVIVRLASPRPE